MVIAYLHPPPELMKRFKKRGSTLEDGCGDFGEIARAHAPHALKINSVKNYTECSACATWILECRRARIIFTKRDMMSEKNVAAMAAMMMPSANSSMIELRIGLHGLDVRNPAT
jgi:hypothetical protein